jgi:hypothetical protein
MSNRAADVAMERAKQNQAMASTLRITCGASPASGGGPAVGGGRLKSDMLKAVQTKPLHRHGVVCA